MRIKEGWKEDQRTGLDGFGNKSATGPTVSGDGPADSDNDPFNIRSSVLPTCTVYFPKPFPYKELMAQIREEMLLAETAPDRVPIEAVTAQLSDPEPGLRYRALNIIGVMARTLPDRVPIGKVGERLADEDDNVRHRSLNVLEVVAGTAPGRIPIKIVAARISDTAESPSVRKEAIRVLSQADPRLLPFRK